MYFSRSFFLPLPSTLCCGQPFYITKLSRFCQPLFSSFFKKFFQQSFPLYLFGYPHLFQSAHVVYRFFLFSSSVFCELYVVYLCIFRKFRGFPLIFAFSRFTTYITQYNNLYINIQIFILPLRYLILPNAFFCKISLYIQKTYKKCPIFSEKPSIIFLKCFFYGIQKFTVFFIGRYIRVVRLNLIGGFK